MVCRWSGKQVGQESSGDWQKTNNTVQEDREWVGGTEGGG
jgi:hypothetical protein